MRKFMVIKYFSISILTLFIITNNVFAKKCFEKSQSLINLQDDYYELEPNVKISVKDKKLLDELYRNIKGQWKGEVAYKICEGHERAPRISLKKAISTVEIKITTNYLLIKTKKRKDDQSIGSQKLKLLGENGLLYLNFENKDHLVFSEIIRKRNAHRGSRLMEQIYKFKFKKDVHKTRGDRLKFSISHYVHGIFVGDETWSMIRD